MHSHVFSSNLAPTCSPHCRGSSGVQARLPCRVPAAAHTLRADTGRSALHVCCSAAVEAERKFASLGPDLWNKTYYPTSADANPVNKLWYTVDAEGQTLGRLATLVANTIRGKTVPEYHASMDMGAYVVVLNAERVVVSGNKFETKLYRRHTGRPGSLKEETFKKLQARIPERIVEKAVRGMLPSGRIGNHLFTHLKVYKGGQHPHSAQQPVDITHKIDKKPSEALSPAPAA